jgi:hypothetical protein
MKAFPEVNYVQPGQGGTSIMTVSGGMDLRDYFASHAMQTILMQNNIDSYGMDFNKIAKQSYHMADAMMEVRNK